jgi:pimeloyl-ACP methyl ester carboxylesterase
MQRAGHLMHLEQPDIFFEAVETFLAGEWPAEAKELSR